ncbi:MAG: response regulator [Planctomycetes bacterium]|nr:response regulator [Planctomycetota bacterium]
MAVDHAQALIVVIDDNVGDLELVTEGLRASGLDARVVTINGGREAIGYMDAALRYVNDPPDLILLDINMPGTNGFQVLEYIRSHGAFADLPVFMFSTSIRACDMERAEQLGATGYMGKPDTFAEYEEIADRLVRFLPPDR